MNQRPLIERSTHAAALLYFRLAAGGMMPPTCYAGCLPPFDQRAARTGPLKLEIVSHCWRYAHFLAYQLSSLVKFPPMRLMVTMTVFYSPEDRPTVDLLERFGSRNVARVAWNWQPLPKERLFRRAIGRNAAALASAADWVWFTDCDLMFRDRCLDVLSERLQGRRDALVYPREERVTSLLGHDDPLFNMPSGSAMLRDIDPASFTRVLRRHRATGPLQITHGDVARACGYCNAIGAYQRPAARWQKAHEDRIFRWLLGTQGVPLDIPGVYRIRHAEKGRYAGLAGLSGIRGWCRRAQERLRKHGAAQAR